MGARYREMGIKTATREQLVVMLYEGAVSNIRRAEALHEEGRLADRGTAISKALAIVAELQQGLDFEVGGEIADPPETSSPLTLRSHGRALEIGRFLSPDERLDFVALDRVADISGSEVHSLIDP